MRLNVGKNKNKNNDGTTDKDLSTVVLWSALDTILVVSVMHLIEHYNVCGNLDNGKIVSYKVHK